jgi:FkbM family methyltransferase
MAVFFVDQFKLLNNLKNLGFYPDVVFDVGVAKGTPWLYDAFNESYFYLFEPVDTFNNDISNILHYINGEHVKLGLSSAAGKASLFIPEKADQHQISTLHYSISSTSKSNQIHEIETTTLDEFCSHIDMPQPCLLKTDVQGHDLNVLQGAVETLKKIDVVISEIPLYGPWGGGNEFHDYIRFMHGQGFIVYDFVEPLRRPIDNRLHSIDVCFVNTKSPLGRKSLYTEGGQDVSESRIHYDRLKSTRTNRVSKNA